MARGPPEAPCVKTIELALSFAANCAANALRQNEILYGFGVTVWIPGDTGWAARPSALTSIVIAKAGAGGFYRSTELPAGTVVIICIIVFGSRAANVAVCDINRPLFDGLTVVA